MKKTIILLLLIIGNTLIAQNKFYYFSQIIDATKIQGKKFILEASVRNEITNQNSSSGLYVKVNKLDKKVGFFNNMWDRPVRNKNWEKYNIEGVIDTDAESIQFGGICQSNGSFYYDDFILKVENNGKWETIKIENSTFENIDLNPWYSRIKNKTIEKNGFNLSITSTKPSEGKKCLLVKGSGFDIYGNDDMIGKFFETNKAKIYYEEYGKGEPLLLLHGNGQSIEAMNNQIDFFKTKYRVIIPDCRGRGKSIDSPEELTYDIQASDMNNLLDHLKIESTNIIGWSDGGVIGLIMAKDYSRKVKKLIASGANVLQDTTAYFSKDLEEFKEIVANPKTSNFYKKLYNLMIKYPNISFTELGKISCPTLIVAGDHDEIRIGHTVKIYEAIPKGQLFILPATSHYLLSENAKVFNDAALKFLNEKE